MTGTIPVILAPKRNYPGIIEAIALEKFQPQNNQPKLAPSLAHRRRDEAVPLAGRVGPDVAQLKLRAQVKRAIPWLLRNIHGVVTAPMFDLGLPHAASILRVL